MKETGGFLFVPVRELQSLENQLIFKVANGAVKVDAVWPKWISSANVGTGGDSSGVRAGHIVTPIQRANEFLEKFPFFVRLVLR